MIDPILIGCLMGMKVLMSLSYLQILHLLREILIKNSNLKSIINISFNKFRRMNSKGYFDEEVHWIYKRLLEKNLEFTSNSNVMKKGIQKILFFINTKRLNITMMIN